MAGFLWVTSCSSVDSAYLDASNKSHMYISSSAFFLVINGYGFVLFDNYQATKWTNSFLFSSSCRSDTELALRKHAHAIYCDFYGRKNDNFQMTNCDLFLIFAQHIDRGYTLEPKCIPC